MALLWLSWQCGGPLISVVASMVLWQYSVNFESMVTSMAGSIVVGMAVWLAVWWPV